MKAYMHVIGTRGVCVTFAQGFVHVHKGYMLGVYNARAYKCMYMLVGWWAMQVCGFKSSCMLAYMFCFCSPHFMVCMSMFIFYVVTFSYHSYHLLSIIFCL